MKKWLWHASHRRPIFLNFRSATWFITTTVCITIFSDIFLYGVIVPVIPFALQARAHIKAENVQHWVSVLLAVYSAAFLISAPIWGLIADRTSSRRTTLLVGMIVLIAATVVLCIGKSIGILLLGRVVQGLSAGLVWTVALALLSDTVNNDELGQAMGYISTSYSIGIFVAPLLGGIVYKQAGYYAVFAMTFGVLVLDVVLRLILIEKKKAAKWLHESVGTELAGQCAGQAVVNSQPEAADTSFSLPNQSTKNGHLITAPLRMIKERKAKKKLPTMLILLRSRRILAAWWGNFVPAITMTALDATLPLFVNRTFGWDSFGAGLIFIAVILPSFAGPVIGHYTDKFGPRWIAASGCLLCSPSWILLRFVDQNTLSHKVLLCSLLVLLGLGASLMLSSLISEFAKVCNNMVKEDPNVFGNRSAYAQSFGIYNLAWSSGSLVGPLWAAAVEARGGWKMMTWTFGLLNGVSVVFILWFSESWRPQQEVEEGEPRSTDDDVAR